MKKIMGIVLLSALLIGGCASRVNPAMQEEPTDQTVSLLEETPTEEQDINNDSNEEENLSKEAEEEASKEDSIEEIDREEAEKKSSEEIEEKKDESNSLSQPAAEKKVEKKEDTSSAELLKSPEPKVTEAKPVSEPAPAPVPAPAPAPEPKPEVIPVAAPEVMVVLTDGTGKNYNTFMDGIAGKLTFSVTTVEHESVAKDVIIEMTTSPGTYKEGSVVKILVSCGKPAAAEVTTYAVTYLSNSEAELIRLVNEYRVTNGLNALEVRADLNKSARYKSKAMIEHNYFSHDNPQDGNVSFSGLMRNVFKYNHYSSFGENLAAQYGSGTQGSAEKFFLQWKNSDGHNKNMLDPNWKYMGIGVAHTNKAGSTFKNYAAALATQHFAR